MANYYRLFIGDSDKFYVKFDGDMKAFLDSEIFKDIQKRYYEYMNQRFPAGGYNDVIKLEVEQHKDNEASGTLLTDATFENLLKEGVRQVEVAQSLNEQNSNAPFDKI